MRTSTSIFIFDSAGEVLAPKECTYYSFTRNVNPISKLKVLSKKFSQKLKG